MNLMSEFIIFVLIHLIRRGSSNPTLCKKGEFYEENVFAYLDCSLCTDDTHYKNCKTCCGSGKFINLFFDNLAPLILRPRWFQKVLPFYSQETFQYSKLFLCLTFCALPREIFHYHFRSISEVLEILSFFYYRNGSTFAGNIPTFHRKFLLRLNKFAF